MNQETSAYEQPPAAPQTSVMAIGSLIAGILGLTLLPTVGSIIGLVLGYMARREIQEAEVVAGERMATAGIVLGWIGVGLTVVTICLTILALALGFAAIPGFTICANMGNGF